MIDPDKIQPLGQEWNQFYEADPETGQAVLNKDRLRRWQEEHAKRLEAEWSEEE